MNIDQLKEAIEQNLNDEEVMRAVAMGAVMADLTRDESDPIGGVALGVALGIWIHRMFPGDINRQERALDSVLKVAARRAASLQILHDRDA